MEDPIRPVAHAFQSAYMDMEYLPIPPGGFDETLLAEVLEYEQKLAASFKAFKITTSEKLDVRQTKHTIGNNLGVGTDEVVEKVLDVLSTYFWRPGDDAGQGQTNWPGRTTFKPHVMHWIQKGEPVKMCLPAYPFKSPNPEKVLGTLPDLAEYLGLVRLNQMCEDIRKVYHHGAEAVIATDGAAFGDLLLISDEEVWEYGKAVHNMVATHGFDKNIKVVYPMQLLGYMGHDQVTEDTFFATIGKCRELVKDQYSKREEDIRRLVEEDDDSRMTYVGFKSFLEADMVKTSYRSNCASRKQYRREMAKLALRMMARSEGFGKLIRAKLPHHVRLSIHPSSGLVKLSICLVPQPIDSVARSPWMSCIAEDRYGVYRTVLAKDVRDTHDVVYHNGQPWALRERVAPYDLVDEKVKNHIHVTEIQV